MFKRGDRVKRIGAAPENSMNHNGMVIGDEDVVEGIGSNSDGSINLTLYRFGKGHSPNYFELIDENEFSYQLTLIAKEFKNA